MIDDTTVARALAALGLEMRVAIYRFLVRAGDGGLSVADIGAHIAAPASTVAHHLGTLVGAGLIVQERQGRQIISRADYAAMRRIMSFLTAECCKGVELVQRDAA